MLPHFRDRYQTRLPTVRKTYPGKENSEGHRGLWTAVSELALMFKKLFAGLMGGRASEASSAPSLEQRRKMSRRPCEIEIEALSGRKGFMGTVTDMGAGGLRLHNGSPAPLKNGSAIRLTYPEPIRKHEVLTVEGIVRWTREREADASQFIGIEYKDQKALAHSWVKAKLHEHGFQSYNLKEQRSQQRARCGIMAGLDLGGGLVTCAVNNLGLGGCFVVLRQPIRAGATITIKLGKHPLLDGASYTGTIRHLQQADPADPFGYGCAFSSLTEEQTEAIKAFLLEQHSQNWERTDDWPDLLYASAAGYVPEEEVEIPDLASILAESPDEDEDKS